MVVGNGMIASAFDDYRSRDKFTIFASGVSNSSTSNLEDFEREIRLIHEAIRVRSANHFVYFSTCSIYDPSLATSPYILHKIEVEKLIAASFPGYTIFRVSNPVGRTKNPSTLINFLASKVKNGEPFEAWQHASRNVIDLEHMYLACNHIILQMRENTPVVNVANPENYSLRYIIECLEEHFKKPANCSWIDKGSSPQINTSLVEPVFKKLNISFGENYFPDLLKKYFPSE